jgi:TRAP-type C4-dicarboxylate transport system permease small subunit
MADASLDNPEMGSHEPIPAGPIEKLCRLLCEITLLVMVVFVGLDIFTRTLFNYSFEIADEVGGYMLIALTFFSLAVTQINDGFHRVEFLQDMLSERWRLISRIAFDLVTLVFAGILFWIFAKFVLNSWSAGNTSPTTLMMPLWLPQLPMALGLIAFALAIIRTVLKNLRGLQSLKQRA